MKPQDNSQKGQTTTKPGSALPKPDASAGESEGAPKPQMLIREGSAPKAAAWKNLPAKEEWCPETISSRFPELKSHAYEDNVSTERLLNLGWRIAGATRRGRHHAHQGTHREDAIRFRSGANYTILCVSDGAGSSRWSRLGSHLAALKVTENLGQQLEKMDPSLQESQEKLTEFLKAELSKAVCLACAALHEAAASGGGAPRDFRCTLLTVLCFHGRERELILSNQIGDGAILVLFKDKTTRLFGTPDSGTFSGEVGCFVPDDCARKKAEEIDLITPVQEIECILLCTDGVEDPFYPLQKKSIDLFSQIYGGVKEALPDFVAQPAQASILNQDCAGWALAEWLGFEKRGENDDRSLLLMHRQPMGVLF